LKFFEKRGLILFQLNVRLLTLRLLMLSVLFLTPLIFFTTANDQFELPKLVFLGLSSAMMLILSLSLPHKPLLGPLGAALLLLVAVFAISSLPGNSLSWQASLLGDYENFAGIATWLTYLACFLSFQSAFGSHPSDKPFFFLSLSAFLSSFYAIGQHFGFDFIQWNPLTVNSTREFASLGNPNFLSAYLAMTLPLWCAWVRPQGNKNPSVPSVVTFISLLLGLLFLFLATTKGHSWAGLYLPEPIVYLFKFTGLALFSISLTRVIFAAGSWFEIPAIAILALGLVSTGSRGGFFAALAGWIVYQSLILKKNAPALQSTPKKFSSLSKGLLFFALLLSILWLGGPFLSRFYLSLTHLGDSLATSRLQIWRPALKMVEAHPVWGVGLDTFKAAFPFYSGIEFNHIDGMFVSSRTAHNEFLQLASTTGLVGFSAYLLVWGLFFLMAFKARKNGTPAQRVSIAGIMGCASAYHLQNFFSFDVSVLALTGFWLLAWVEGFSPKPLLLDHSAIRYIRAGLFGFLIVLGLAFWMTRFIADLCFAQAQTISNYLKNPEANAQTPDLIAYSNVGIRLNQRSVDLCPLEVKYLLYLGLTFEQRAQLERDQLRPWLETALNLYRQAIRMSSANAYYYNDEGRVSSTLGDIDASYRPLAVVAYQKAVHFAPASPFFWANLSMAQEDNGQSTDASLSRQKAFGLDSAFTARCLSQAAVLDYQTGRKAEALERLRVSMDGNTSVSEPYYYRGLIEMDAHQNREALNDFLEAKKRVDPANPGSMTNLVQLIDQISALSNRDK
jgi:hypothetical protein